MLPALAASYQLIVPLVNVADKANVPVPHLEALTAVRLVGL